MKRIFSLLIILFAGAGFAQKSKQTTPVIASIKADDYKNLKWRNVGPFRGGRANAIAGVIQQDQVYYTGYTGGGLWKTEDGGKNWKNISDGQFNVGTIGKITVSENDPNVIYVGSGEHAVRGVMTSFGDGVYKSTDAGQTWKNIGLQKSRHIADIVVHPTNSDVVLVAAQGAVHGPNPERGIYKSTDGGTTWKRTLYIDENTGVSSLSMDMTNPRILYAATWPHRRYPWKVESGPNGQIWKSTDLGETWTKINEGLPEVCGKIGVSVSRANPSRVYAIVEAERSKAGLYRSDDGGKKWTLMTNDQNLTARSWYYMEVYADPINSDIVWVLNAPVFRSIDGGKTFQNISIAHGDTHDLWISPKNNSNVALADDGGGQVSYNAGGSWSSIYNQPTAQFYRVSVDNQVPYWLYGGQQDNSSVMIASRAPGYGISEKDWMNGPGCESAWIAFDDPENPQKLFGGCYQGIIDVLDVRTRETKDIMEYPALNLAWEPRKMKYRFNWNAPILNSPHDPKVMYHAGNVLFRSSNGGMSWEKISGDLTRNDTTRQGKSGGPITNEGAGGENYNTIYYVIESPHRAGTIYTGSDCGLVYLTQDHGKNWKNITPQGLPECSIHSIEVSQHDPGTVYISANRYKFNDFGSYTYKSTDYGTTWTKIVSGIDADDFIKVIREDRIVKNLLYAGSERGFYISNNGGKTWNKFQLNLPVVPVTDLQIRQNDLIASTAGRAFWILDDLSAIQQSEGVIGIADFKLFQPKATYRLHGTPPEMAGAELPGLGKNPVEGVTFDYYLREKSDTAKVTLEILDMNNQLLRTFSSVKDANYKPYPGGPSPGLTLPTAAGVNRVTWDFRTAGLTDVPGVFVYGDYRGHRVPPGKYKARLLKGAGVSEVVFEILQDPRLQVQSAAWDEQQKLLDVAEKSINDMHRAVNELRNVKKQLDAQQELLKRNQEVKDLTEKGKSIIKQIDHWESDIIEPRSKNGQDIINWPSKMNAEFMLIRSSLDSYDPRVTQGVRDRLSDLMTEWKKAGEALNQISTEVEQYNRIYREKNLPAVISETKPELLNN